MQDPIGFKGGDTIRLGQVLGKKGLVFVVAAVVIAASTITIAWIAYRSGLGVVLSVDTDKAEYAPGESVHIQLRLKNYGFSTVELVYGTSATYLLIIIDSDGEQLFYEPKYVLEIITRVELGPGESKSWGRTWEQVNDTGEQVELPGLFTVLVFAGDHEHDLRARATFSISSRPILTG